MTLAIAIAIHIGVPARQLPAGTTIALDEAIPFDGAVRTTTLPNGMRVFIRHNERPAKRVALRLAVTAGSIDEADDQQGLAHLIEHMAFNGTAHFKPGDLVSYFESIGARLGPHVNAFTSFDETVYMFELPTDKPEVIAKGLTALADFAGGLTLDPIEIDKERGVVIEEWRLGLGANSRIRDKQLPVLFFNSRYAERLPIGKPDIIRTAPAARLRAFYDAWYRPERMAVIAVGDIDAQQTERDVRATFGTVMDRAAPLAEPNRTVPLDHQPLVNVSTDPELTQSSVQVVEKRPRMPSRRVRDYRREIVERLVDHMINERFGEIVRRPDAKVLAAAAGGGGLSRTVETFTLRATVADGRLQDGLTALEVEAKRLRDFGFGAAELDRAKRSLKAVYERAFSERDKTENGAFAQELLDYFLENEPMPGIEYERRLAAQLLPGITVADVSTLVRARLAGESQVVLAAAPQKQGIAVPSAADLTAAMKSADAVSVAAWKDQAASKTLMERLPPAAAITSRREFAPLGVTVVRLANGIEAWLKPTDFKNDQVVFTLEAPGGTSLAAPQAFADASLAATYVGLAGVGGISGPDLQKLLAGKLAAASPFIGLSTHGISGAATPMELETALQLLHQAFRSPNDDADSFTVLKRQLATRAANREQSPQQVFADRVAQVTTSNHYTAQPLTAARVESLDRAAMLNFYRARFSNAADFTFFIVGAFKVNDAVPLLARYVGSLPSIGRPTSRVVDLGIHFPTASERVRVERGHEPRSQTVLSFFADPPPVPPTDIENVLAATVVLDIVLRDVLREELGQTYTVNVGLVQPLPQRGGGHIDIRFGGAPENVDAMIERASAEVKRLQRETASDDLITRAKESARRTYETSLRENGYWLQRLTRTHLLGEDPGDIVTRGARIDAVTPASVQSVFQRYFPFDRLTVITLVPER
jgi:zinc protease